MNGGRARGGAGTRGLLWRIVAHSLFWSGLGPLVAWLWRRRTPASWTVLAYHRVGTPVQDGGPDHVNPDRFRRQLRYLRRRYQVVTVGEAIGLLRSGRCKGRPLLSITFDDGYRDNVETAMPILLQEGCRATLYPTLEAVETGRAPWTHRLAADLGRCARMGTAPSSSDRPVSALIGRFLSGCPGADRRVRAGLIRAAIAEAKLLPDADRRGVCAQAAEIAGGPDGRNDDMLSPESLRRWLAAGMEVGSHTAGHGILSHMPAPERLEDLTRSRLGLEDRLGIAIVHLAYPNGRPGDWNREVAADARKAGYVSAVSTIEGVNRPGFDPFGIRRISVGDDAVPVLASRVSPLGILLRSALGGSRAQSGHEPPNGGAHAGADAPLRVAFIGGRGVGSAYSGIERYYEELGSRLVARGHRVLAYCRPHFAPDTSIYRGIEVRRLPTIRAKHLETFVHSLLATADVCFRKVDIVQFHALGSSPLAWVPRLARKRTVVSVRGLDWQRAKWGWLARAYLRFCETTSVYCPNATAVVSRTLKGHFERSFGRPVRYIPNGVAPVEPLPPRDIARWGLARQRYFLYAGRLSPEKGLDTMIEAHHSVPEVRLVLAGGSSYSEDYMDRLRASAAGNVVFTGFLTGTLLQEVYSNALAFILPSRMEGLSVALLEALSYGLPVIASDIPENREVVDDCGGFLFRLDDAADLARVMRKVAGAPDEALRVGAQARERVRDQLDWERIADQTAAFYREVIAGRGRTGVAEGAPLAAGPPPAPPRETGGA